MDGRANRQDSKPEYEQIEIEVDKGMPASKMVAKIGRKLTKYDKVNHMANIYLAKIVSKGNKLRLFYNLTGFERRRYFSNDMEDAA